MKIILSGGTGFIGKPLFNELVKKQHKIVVLTKHPSSLRHLESDFVELVRWDRKTLDDSWVNYVNGSDVVINLCGEPISDIRWTKEQKEIIASSRIDSTKALVAAIEKASEKPTTLINASAVGYYGHVESVDVTEDFPKGEGFLANTCYRWEKAAYEARAFGTRVVTLRTGVVLGKGGGALRKMVPPFEMYTGGYPGSGKQWFPWIHRDDIVGAIIFAQENSTISGPINVTAPNPVTMKDFCVALGKALGKPCWGPIPSVVIRAVMGEMADMVLQGQKAIPKVLLNAGYSFRFKYVEEALEAIFEKALV